MWCSDFQVHMFFSCILSQWNNKDNLISRVDTPLSDIFQSITATSFPVSYSEPPYVHYFIGFKFIKHNISSKNIYPSIYLATGHLLLNIFLIAASKQDLMCVCWESIVMFSWLASGVMSHCCLQWLSSVQRRVRPVVQHQCPSGGCCALHYSWAIWIHAKTLAQRQVPVATTDDPAPIQHQHQSASVLRVCASQHQGNKHSNH